MRLNLRVMKKSPQHYWNINMAKMLDHNFHILNRNSSLLREILDSWNMSRLKTGVSLRRGFAGGFYKIKSWFSPAIRADPIFLLLHPLASPLASSYFPATRGDQLSLFPLKTSSTAEALRTRRDILFCDPIVRGDWITRLILSGIDSDCVRPHSGSKRGFF